VNVESKLSREAPDFSALEIRTVKSGLMDIASQDGVDEEEILKFLRAKHKEYATQENLPQNRKAMNILLQQIEEGRVTISDILEKVRPPEKGPADRKSGLKKFFRGFLRR